MNQSSLSFEDRVLELEERFEALTPSEKYEQIISLGMDLPEVEPDLRTDDTLVRGCQSQLYIHSSMKQGKVYFRASSEALISRGLAALLIHIYDGFSPETIISSPPHFLELLGIHASLSPNRSQGISHIYLKMKLQVILLVKNDLRGSS